MEKGEENEMLDKILNHLIGFLIMVYIFFYYLTSDIFVWILSIGIILTVILKVVLKTRIGLNNNINYLLFGSLILFILLSLVINQNYNISSMLNFYIWFFCFIMYFLILLIGEDKLIKTIYRYIFIGSAIHVICSYLIQFQIPVIMNLIPILLNVDLVNQTNLFINSGANPGITGQIGRLAFYIMVGISIIFSWIYTKKNHSKMLWLILALYVVALLLTTKRAAILCLVLCFIILYFIKMLKKGIGKWGIFFSILSIIIITFNYTEILNFLEGDIEDISNGRFSLYYQAIQLISENPIFGYGFYYFSQLMGLGVHNIYLQLWVESGVFSLVLFIIIILFNLYLGLKNVWKTDGNHYVVAALFFQIYFVIYGFFGNPLYDKYMLLVFLISIFVNNYNYNKNKYDGGKVQ